MTIRVLLVLGFLFLLYTVLIGRLFYWQVLRSDEIRGIALAQSASSLTLPARRGDILTSDEYSLATNKISYLLYANPKVIQDKEEYIEKLSPLLSVPESSLAAALVKDLFWVKLANDLSLEQKEKIEKLSLDGLGFSENSYRYYPESSMSAHLVGFVGRDAEGANKGYFGLEGFYDSQLAGRSGKLYTIHDALGNIILNDIREEKKIDGRTLVLTLDRVIQFAAERKLKEGIEKYEAEGGSIIVMEPKTGKILAMASYPRFDPQAYYDFDGASYKNPVISSVYEPGSTFKVLVMAAGIDKGVIAADTKCDICSAPVQVGEYSIKTWNGKYYPNTTMTEAIQHSDNTGMVFAGRKLGLENLYYYLQKFGIGEVTGVDLQGETSGTLREKDEWYPIDLATATFGQGLSVTPLQLLSAVSSIANGGILMKPYVMSEVRTAEGKHIKVNPEVRTQVISDTTAKVVTEMMVNAVQKGESKWTKIEGYKIAGKTGTAQIPVEGRYDKDKTIASFVGFFPARDPEISMLVLIDRPKTSIFGSETAAPIFFSVARDIITYYGIQPEE